MLYTENKFKRHTITTALPYANGPIHIGHLAGVYVPADIYARYLRLQGEDVLFIGGSDEHGVPITIKAKNEGISPQDVVDRYHAIIKKSFKDLGITFDVYSRTSDSVHHRTSSEFFEKLYQTGKLVEQVTQQYYDEEAKQFLADRYITGVCPHCSNENAYGDQCESCGTSLNATELINPKSMLSGSVPVLKDTKHWFLPLNQYEDFLREWILKGHKNDWRATVYGQCKSWIDMGLQPRAVTRDLDWGVKLPLPDTDGKVLYVWFDAPIGYISASKVWAEETKRDWQPYWKDKDTKMVHFIGKDNIVFHCIIFPVMLQAEGTYILPENVPANEFMNLEDDKISTSRNWAVWLHEYLEDFKDKQDVLRYVLTSNAPETKDNNFTWKDFQTKNNSELLAIFGNFINRTIVLTHKFYQGNVPPLPERHCGLDPQSPEQGDSCFRRNDEEVLEQIKKYPELIGRNIELYHFRDALNELMNLARLGNKYLTDNEPWKTIKDNPQRVQTVMNIALQIAAGLAILCEPFLPFTAKRLQKMLRIDGLTWKDVEKGILLADNHAINEAELLFDKIEDDAIALQLQKLEKSKAENLQSADNTNLQPQKELISFDDFSKMDLRICEVLEAEKVPKTKKLLKLRVNTGIDKRYIVSGIAEYYNPEDLIGKKVLMLVNLQAREIKGIESQGMILMAENSNGELSIVTPEKEMENGGTVK